MPSIVPDPTAIALRYRFAGDECLYRDVRGARVVADFEGACTYRVEARSSCEIVADGLRREELEGACLESLTVVALPGQVLVEIARGDVPSVPPTKATGRIEGVGFVLAARGDLRIDARREASSSPSDFLPIPFFSSAESEKPFEVALFENYRAVSLDAFDIGDAAALKERGWSPQNISKVESLLGRFSDGTEHEAPVASHLNAASWNCPVPGGCAGLVVAKTYDRFHGRQRARVLVDGRHAGWWYEPVENRERRWGEARFGIPGSLLEGKSSVRLSIDPVAGSPLWSVGRIEAFAILRSAT